MVKYDAFFFSNFLHENEYYSVFLIKRKNINCIFLVREL